MRYSNITNYLAASAAVLCLLATTSCSKDGGVSSETVGKVAVSMETKATADPGDGTTFRLMAHGTDLAYKGCSTLKYIDGERLLASAKLNDDGTEGASGTMSDLTGIAAGDYLLYLVSPGIKNTGSKFNYTPATTSFYSNVALKTTLTGGYTEVDFTSGNPMKDLRSRLNVNVYVTERMKDQTCTVDDGKAVLKGVGTGAMDYIPATRQPMNADLSREVILVDHCSDPDASRKKVDPADGQNIYLAWATAAPVYIPAGVYSADKAVIAQQLNTLYTTLSDRIEEDNANIVDGSAPLSLTCPITLAGRKVKVNVFPNGVMPYFAAQCEYTLNIVVLSPDEIRAVFYITSVADHNWTDGGTSLFDFGDPIKPIPVTFEFPWTELEYSTKYDFGDKIISILIGFGTVEWNEVLSQDNNIGDAIVNIGLDISQAEWGAPGSSFGFGDNYISSGFDSNNTGWSNSDADYDF